MIKFDKAPGTIQKAAATMAQNIRAGKFIGAKTPTLNLAKIDKPIEKGQNIMDGLQKQADFIHTQVKDLGKLEPLNAKTLQEAKLIDNGKIQPKALSTKFAPGKMVEADTPKTFYTRFTPGKMVEADTPKTFYTRFDPDTMTVPSNTANNGIQKELNKTSLLDDIKAMQPKITLTAAKEKAHVEGPGQGARAHHIRESLDSTPKGTTPLSAIDKTNTDEEIDSSSKRLNLLMKDLLESSESFDYKPAVLQWDSSLEEIRAKMKRLVPQEYLSEEQSPEYKEAFDRIGDLLSLKKFIPKK